MIATKNASVALLLLAAISSRCHGGLRNGGANKVKRKLNDDDNNKNLFKDDEGFWTRYVEEVSESIPTPRPTPFPFPGPTPPPTPSPTPEPTLSPTPAPTPAPTPQPTPPPGTCAGSAEIGCVAADGTACTDLESPAATCTVGSSVDSISFVVEYCTCEESKNSQGGDCTDEGGELPGPDATVRFTCTDPDNNLLFSQNVQEGGVVPLQAAEENTPVPEVVTCSLFTESGELLQTVVIDTSGTVDLLLGDKFGSLTLVSCGDADCLTDVTYTYTTCNIGDTNLSVIKFERDREGDMVDLLPQINPEIPPDSCETASETETISLCVEDGFFTTIVMEDSTGNCGAEEDYFFELQPETPPPETGETLPPETEEPETPPPELETAPPNEIPAPLDCSVEVEVTCKTEDGVDCIDVIPPVDCSPLEVCYEYEVSNVGTSDMDITTLERTRNEETVSLMDQLVTTTLPPGDSTFVVEKELVDFCVGASHCTDVIAEADPPNGNSCADTEEYCLIIEPPLTPPTPTPSASPTPEVCEFQMEIECPNCNATPPPVEQCAGRPLAMGWIYSGGGCENSWNVQEEKFICEDFNGGPPTELGEKSFIVVTDADGSMTYTREYVEVGSLYEMNSGGERFSADSLITVYKNNNTGDLANLLQSVQYHSSCSSTLFLKNRFGAHILVQWTNEEQGTISCFANQTFNIEVDIPMNFEGGPATVTSLTVASNVDPFFFNLTSGVAGTQVNAGDTFQTAVAVPIDLSVKKEYNMLVTLSAETAGGTTCTAVDIVSFTAGYPLPPTFPTFAPTGPPDEA